MKKKLNGLICLILACVITAICFTGCASVSADSGEKKDAPAAEETADNKRDDLIIAIESEPPTLHPFDHKAVTAGYMNALTYNCLFKLDLDTLEPIPDLCESYEQETETKWIFHLRQGVMFHDGSIMTAEDVKASMEYARNYPTTKQYSSFWSDVTVVDDYTVRVTTNGSYALTLFDMASNKIVPKALIDSENDFSANPVGSGPYKFVSWTLGDRLEFEANDNYFDAAHQPSIKHMTWRIIPEGSSRTIALEAGEVDFVVEVETTDLERLRESDAVNVTTVAGTRMNYFTMNNEVYPFNNADFRKAVNCAIDREAVLTVALNGEGLAAQSVCPSVFPGTSNDNVEGYDPEKAKAYLEASGVDTTALTFSCIVSNDTSRRAAEVVQAYLSEVGIEMTIESLDYAAWLSDVMSGNCMTAITGYTASNLARYLTGTFHTSALDAANQARFSDDHVDELIDKVLTLTDEDEANAVYQEVTAYLNSCTPYVPLYESIVTRAYNAKLQGVVVGASGTVRFEDVSWAE